MFLNILSVSLVCVLLAYNGWEPDDSHTSVDSPALLRIDNQSAEVQYINIPHRSVNGTACQRTSLYDVTDTKMCNRISLYDMAFPDFVNGSDRTDTCTEYPVERVPVMDPEKEDNMIDDDDNDDDDDDGDDEIKKVPDLKNTTIPMETLRGTTGPFTTLSGSVTRPILTTMQLGVKDYRSVREEKSAVCSYQIIDNSRSGRVKNTVLLVELRLIVPFLMIIICIRERVAQAAQLKEMRMVHIQKPDFGKRDDRAIIKGQGNCSQAKKQDKTVPKLEEPGRQQRRRGRGRRQRHRSSATYHKERAQ